MKREPAINVDMVNVKTEGPCSPYLQSYCTNLVNFNCLRIFIIIIKFEIAFKFNERKFMHVTQHINKSFCTTQSYVNFSFLTCLLQVVCLFVLNTFL